MGSHPCEYCYKFGPKGQSFTGQANVFSASSTGEVDLAVTGQLITVRLPDMILHYVHDHGFYPGEWFVDLVMNDQLVVVHRIQSKGIDFEMPPDAIVYVGYLSGEFSTGENPEGFLEKLEALMNAAWYASYPDREPPYRVKK